MRKGGILWMYVLRNGNFMQCRVIFYANALPLRKIFVL